MSDLIALALQCNGHVHVPVNGPNFEKTGDLQFACISQTGAK